MHHIFICHMLAAALAASATCFPASAALAQSHDSGAGKRIVFVAGPRSHGYGSHEHNAGCLLLAEWLKKAMPEIETVVHQNGWPEDSRIFDGADSVVLFSDGGGGNPMLPHLDAIQELVDNGVGFVCLHYAVEVPKGEAGDEMLRWIGGYFETFWSVNPHWVARFTDFPDHPVARGLVPFGLNDEWYYHMRFAEAMEGVTPILTAVPPDSTRERPDGAHSNNPVVRSRRAMPEHVGWVYDRPNGGRGFGFTGGHFHWNWGHDMFRKAVLNGIAWTAHIEIPSEGIETPTPTVDELMANMDEPVPDNFDRLKIEDQLVQWKKEVAEAKLAEQARQEAALPENPNIIFVMADDLGYGDLGCYGQEVIQTPNLDRMAAEGMRFTDCYAGSTVCAPSRCVLMTGLHSGHAWVRGNARVPLRPDDVTVAEVLKQAGYQTAIIGKWGLGEPETTGIPNRQGFDYWFGYLNQRHAHNYYPAYLWRNEERIPLPNEVNHVINGRDRRPGGVATKREVYSHDLFTEEALAFLDRAHDAPFFLYLAYTIPHANNEAGNKGMEVPDYGPYADKDWPDPQKGLAAMITRMDRDMGTLLEKLQELGIDEETIVFFTSDNGPHKEGGSDPYFFQSMGPLNGYKRSLHDGGIRVPMIVRWPGRIQAGSINTHVWAFWDFLPTAAELAGLETPEGIDGISVVPSLLQRGKQAEHEFLYWEFHEGGASKQAVRMRHWKAVRVAGRPLQLYDLVNDIAEENDIADEHPEIAAQIEEYLEGARTENEHWPLRAASSN